MNTLSIVIPIKNEAKSLPELLSRLNAVLSKLNWQSEIIFVDDGSRDETYSFLEKISKQDKSVKIVSLSRNFGKAAALSAGFDSARGDVVVTMDGDLQHKPEDIPKFLAKIDEGADMVISWREKRKDNALTRKIPSWFANRFIAKMSGLPLHDFGGTFHAYKRELLEGIELYSELHRFIPALVNWRGSYRVAEVSIENPPRKFGSSNYGLWRIVRVLFDLVTIKYLSSYITHSLYFFGLFGLSMLSLGGLGTVFLIIRKLSGVLILTEHGPLFITSIFLLLVGIQLILFGLMTEVLSRVYHSSTNKKTYRIRQTVNI
ncbi:MAG TPA: glycosyltransferase family 2 protein [Candidatus Paceibacterota bacterium]